MDQDKDFKDKIEDYNKLINELRDEIHKAVIGQEKVINTCIRALIANGHVLLEGVPGIAKTLLVRTFSVATGCMFSRIQFTPDLLPTDIIGITAFEKDKGFYVIKGPIFANFVLADEINRAPPKVQSALLECMQERQATIGKEVFGLEPPFFVLATQNPIESLGTYPLPEAQVDRFLFKLLIEYPDIDSERKILNINMTLNQFEELNIQPILDPYKIYDMQADVKKIYVDKKIEKYIVKIIDATRNPSKYKIKLGQYTEYGASPRGSIGLFISSKAEALMQKRMYVTPQDVKAVAVDVLRHRILINYDGQAEGIRPDQIINEILSKIPIP